MRLFELYPLILFAFSIIFTIVLHIQKSHKINLNEAKKILRDESEKAIKKVEQKVVEIDEVVNIKKDDVDQICAKVNSKIQELKIDSAELDQLRDALNTYRNMLAQLNIATDQTHNYIVQTNDDATKLQNLRELIDKQERQTYEILKSFDVGVKEQKNQMKNLEIELHNQSQIAMNEILSARDDSLNQISDQIEKYQSIFDTCNAIQSKHDVILKELNTQQSIYEKKLEDLNKEFCDKVKSVESEARESINTYIHNLETSSMDYFSSLEKERMVAFENGLENKKNEVLISINSVLQSSSKIINEYNDSVKRGGESTRSIEKQSFEEDINNYNVSQDLNNINKSENLNSIDLKDKKNKKFEKKLKKKNLKKDSSSLVDILDLEPNLEDVIKKDKSCEILEDIKTYNITSFEKETKESDPLEDINESDLLKNKESINEINLDGLEKIESNINLKESEDDNFDETLIELDDNVLDNKNYENQSKEILDNQLNKFSGTGFGTLLNSYGSNKKPHEEFNKDKVEPKSFKPGSILEKLVVDPEKSVEKGSDNNEISQKIEKDNIIDKKIISNNNSFELIGEEEEILLD